MTDNEVKALGEIVKMLSEGTVKGDEKILDLITFTATKTRDVMLELVQKVVAINDKVVDLDERLHRLENK